MSLPEVIPSDLPVYTRTSSQAAFANSVIPEGSVLLFAESDSNGDIKLKAKNPDGSFTTVGGGSPEAILGVVNAEGKFQPFKFDGTTPSNSGSAETVEYYKSWNSTLPNPDPSPTIALNFYKCSYVNTSNNTWRGYKAVFN